MAKFQTWNNAKLCELIIYIAEHSKDDTSFGAVKLNKLLYYSDFSAYRQLRNSITDAEYQHIHEGPAPRHLLPARKQLLKEDAIEIKQVPYYSGVQQRIIPKRTFKRDLFTDEELKIVDEVIHDLKPLNGSEVTERSHRELGWRLTQESETIHYRTAWLSSEPLTEEQVSHGKKVAERHGFRRKLGTA